MNTHSDKTAIQAVLDAVRQGLHGKDAAAIGAQFAPEAVIYDLAPPLAHGLDIPGLSAWLDGWDGPVGQKWRDVTIAVSDDLAFCHGLCKMSATTKADGQHAQWWQRTTVCLRQVGSAWKIVHEHSSVPFHMDGSFLAATDLQP